MEVSYMGNASLLVLLVIVHLTHGLYEDQIGKFDWRRLHIGKVKQAVFDPNSSHEAFVITEEDILASLCTRTNELKWRQIFENPPRGTIKLFHVISEDNSNSPIIKNSNKYDLDILTVSGVSPSIVRGWSGTTGNLQWEWSMTSVQSNKAVDAVWFYENYYLYHVVPVWNSHLEVTKYFATTGHPQGTTSKLTAPWIEKNKCVLSESYFVCTDKNQLISIDLTEDKPKVYRKSVSFDISSIPKPLKNRKGYVIVNNKVTSLKTEDKNCPQAEGTTILFTKLYDREVYVVGNAKDEKFQISTIDANSCERIQDLSVEINYPDYYGSPEIVAFKYQPKKNEKQFNMLVSTSDGALLFIQENKIKFAREESLASIAAAELIDLPLSDGEGAMESEFNSKPGDIAGAFIRRITAQAGQLKNLILHLFGMGQSQQTQQQKAGLVRDAFGLHKMLVVLTKSGKLIGIDNLSGQHHWIKLLSVVENFKKNENMKLIVQRTSKHFPHQPLCTVIAKDKETGNGIIYQFNPITGQPAEAGLQRLNFKIKQLALLRENEEDFIKGLLLLDHNNNVTVIPKSSTEKANGMYLYTADKLSASLEGYHIYKNDNNDEQLHVLPIWKVKLSGPSNNHKIVTVAEKNPNEHVHSQGRVLGDRSVLYKYINPNLVAVVTQTLDNIHKYVMNVHLIDVVSGSIVFSMTHRKVKGPIHVVHSENWLVYSYYNDKVRRHEMTTVELYEGKIQANSTVWSSLDAPPLPLIEKQSFIFPAYIQAMKETITERGITNKHVLIGLSSGAVLEMPWAFLDPRRPVSNQAREEGAIPYIPELPLPTENIINYNQSIARIRNIYTAPSGLESTCLVVVYGLDLYVTRVSPSKTFDLLKEDFDYFLITVVLTGLTIGSFVTKHLSSRKALKQAWK